MLHIIYRDYFISNYIFEGIKDESLHFIRVPILTLNLFQRCIFYLERKLKVNLYPRNRFNREVIKEISKIDCQDSILFFDFALYIDLLFVKKRVNTNSLKLWLWNPLPNDLRNASTLEELKKIGISIYTFDILNARNFQINLLNQVYKKVEKDNFSEIEYDFFFIGIDKGRIDKLFFLANEFKVRGYTFKFMVYPNTVKAFPCIEYLDKLMSCEEVVESSKKARVIVELVQENQSGMTLRVLEGLFLGKKILTDNLFIKKSELYNPMNIFILGESSWEGLEEFIESEFVEYEHGVLSKYMFDVWIDNFK